MSMLLYESALQGDRELRSLSLCFFPRRGMASGSLPELLWTLLQLMELECHCLHLAVPCSTLLNHPSDDSLTEAHSGEEGPLREDGEASK